MKTLFRTIAFALLTALSLQAQGQGDLVDRLDKALGVSLPTEYKKTVIVFVDTNYAFREKDDRDFIENYIIEKMKDNWGIDKQNQLLFIWDAIYMQITNNEIYTGEDGNQKRLDDYEKAIDNVEEFGKMFVQEFTEDILRRTEESKRRTAIIVQRIIVMDYTGLKESIWFYTLYKKDSSVIREDEIKKIKEFTLHYISDCKKYNVDYQLLLPTEVLRFYGIQSERSKHNTLTCEQATIQLLNIQLKEIVKLYNMSQQYPQVEGDTPKIEDDIKDCKEYNIDYRTILQKELGSKQKVDELLKFFGVE